jgi:hypothetical protein
MLFSRNARWLLPACLLATSLALPAAAQEACKSYTIKDGDTLGSISFAAYGRLEFQLIFNANAAVIKNPSKLQPGTEIAIPCEDGRRTDTSELAAISADESKTGSDTLDDSGAYRPTIKILTGGDWTPFTDENLSGGGFLIRLTSTAMKRAGNNRNFNISWIDDWGSHTDVLLPSGAFDFDIAWYVPDCAASGLSAESIEFCETYDFSDSLYDAVFGFYAKEGTKWAAATSFDDYKGAHICRPEGYSNHDLDAVGLIEPVVKIAPPPPFAIDCLQGVLDGTYDVVSFETQAVEPLLKELGEDGKLLIENSYISSVQAIAAMSMKSNPRGREGLTMLNNGMREMRESGEWYDIVSSSLAEALKMSESQ